MANDCIFCKIISGSIPAPRVYEDDDFVCIKDIQPQAKAHLLVLPRKHVAHLDAVYAESGDGASQGARLIGRLFEVAAKIAREQGLMPEGYRAVLNTNANGGQTVFHLHLHLLGGEPLQGGFGA